MNPISDGYRFVLCVLGALYGQTDGGQTLLPSAIQARHQSADTGRSPRPGLRTTKTLGRKKNGGDPGYESPPLECFFTWMSPNLWIWPNLMPDIAVTALGSC